MRTFAEVWDVVHNCLNGDFVNPRDSNGTCIYTNEDGDKHCIAGQILVELEMPVPEPYDSTVWTCDAFVDFETEAKECLNQLQSTADRGRYEMDENGVSVGFVELTWREAIERVDVEFLPPE